MTSYTAEQAHCSPALWARTTVRLLSLDHDLRLLCNWWLISEAVSEDVTGWPTDVSFHILPEQMDYIHTPEGITST